MYFLWLVVRFGYRSWYRNLPALLNDLRKPQLLIMSWVEVGTGDAYQP